MLFPQAESKLSKSRYFILFGVVAWVQCLQEALNKYLMNKGKWIVLFSLSLLQKGSLLKVCKFIFFPQMKFCIPNMY